MKRQLLMLIIMMMRTKFAVIKKNLGIQVFILFLVGCVNPNKEVDILVQLEERYNSSFVYDFKKTADEEVVDKYIDTLNFNVLDLLKKEKKTRQLFKKYGVQEDYKQIALVIYSWHQKLNLKSFILEEHLKSYDEQVQQGKINAVKIEELSRTNYLRFEIGDTIVINYPVSILENGFRRAFKYKDPIAWEFSKDKDFAITGSIVDKIIGSSNNRKYTFVLKVIELNRVDTYFFTKRIKQKDTVRIDLTVHPSSIVKYSR